MTKNTKMPIILSGVAALTALFMILCIKVLLPVCTGMLELTTGKLVFMKCHYTAVACVFFAVLMLVDAIISIWKKQYMTCGILLIAIAVFTWIAWSDSLGIGMCVKTEMACRTTAPVIKMCATIEALLGMMLCVCAKKQS